MPAWGNETENTYPRRQVPHHKFRFGLLAQASEKNTLNVQRWGKEQFTVHGLEGAIVSPSKASPIPHNWKNAGDGAIRSECHKPLRDFITEETYAANNYWQSGMASACIPGAASPHSRGKRSRIQVGSTWDELRKVARKPRRVAGKRSLAAPQKPARWKRLCCGNAAPASLQACAVETPLARPSFDGGARRWLAAPPVVAADVLAFQAKWIVLGLLGKGKFGAVLRARRAVAIDGGQSPDLAIKTYVPEHGDMEPWLQKYCVHDNVLPVVEAFCTPFWAAIVTECCAGTLYDHMRFCGEQVYPFTSTMLGDIVAALTCLHAREVVHLDLHSNNIVVKMHDGGKSPDDGRVASYLLSDFGHAVHLGHQPADGLPFLAHPDIYRAPEIYCAQGASLTRKRCVSHWSGIPLYTVPTRLSYASPADMWAFGCLLCDIAGGQSPCAVLRREPEERAERWYGRVVQALLHKCVGRSWWDTARGRALGEDPFGEFRRAPLVGSAVPHPTDTVNVCIGDERIRFAARCCLQAFSNKK